MQRLPVPPALRSRLAAIDVVTGEGEVTVLPRAGAVLGLQLRGRVRAEDRLLSITGITGIQQGPRRYGYLGDTVSILLRFTPQGAACLGVPASDLIDRSFALDEMIPATRVRLLEERLESLGDPAGAVPLLEALLLGMPLVADRAVERALALLARPVPVAEVAHELGLSERQLERRFLHRVGISPKRYAMLCRFERAVDLVHAGLPLSLVATEAGYSDQSHFNREVRRFAGLSPGQLLPTRP